MFSYYCRCLAAILNLSQYIIAHRSALYSDAADGGISVVVVFLCGIILVGRWIFGLVVLSVGETVVSDIVGSLLSVVLF